MRSHGISELVCGFGYFFLRKYFWVLNSSELLLICSFLKIFVYNIHYYIFCVLHFLSWCLESSLLVILKLIFFTAHNAVVTSAIFAPNPSLMLSLDVQSEKSEGNEKGEDAEVLETMPSGRYLCLFVLHALWSAFSSFIDLRVLWGLHEYEEYFLYTT